MITETELKKAIEECENLPPSYQNCEKLAVFYTLYNHLYNKNQTGISLVQESVIDNYGDNEFYSVICGKNPAKVWKVIDELMSVLQGVMPKLYNGTINKIIDA